MIRENADRLRRVLEGSREWPPRREVKLLRDLRMWAALREADEDYLKPEEWGDHPYLVDPLAGRIAEAKADLIFGEEPDFIAARESNQSLLEQLIEENQFPTELQWGAQLSVSEGQMWWRAFVDKSVQDTPIIEFHSRSQAYPLFRGRNLLAVAFISVIQDGDDAWRQVEIHAEGLVQNLLYKVPINQSRGDTPSRSEGQPTGGSKPFGEQVDLSQRPETEDLVEEWPHDLPSLLAGRILNRRGRRASDAISDYARVKGLLLSLNEATTIGHRNMKLTAKKRAVITQAALSAATVRSENGQTIAAPPPEFDSNEELYVVDSLDEELSGDNVGPMKILEYSFDATALIDWNEHMEDKILIRCRVAPQLVGRHTEQAQTGPAMRARLLDSILDSQGKARSWDDETPKMLQALQLIDALPTSLEGFGRGYTDAAELPAMTRKSSLPEDETEELNRHVQAVNAGLEAQKTAIASLHPEWDEQRITDEINDINGPEAEAPPPPGGE